MLYFATVEAQEIRIEINQQPDGSLQVGLPDGRQLSVSFETALGDDLLTLLIDNQSHQVHVEVGQTASEYAITLDGQSYQTQVLTERQHRLATLVPRDSQQSGEVQIKAPMPGLVSQVSVEVGQTVEKGQRIVILEAMKMENELKTPRAGIVKSLNVTPGTTVEQNRVLAVIE